MLYFEEVFLTRAIVAGRPTEVQFFMPVISNKRNAEMQFWNWVILWGLYYEPRYTCNVATYSYNDLLTNL